LINGIKPATTYSKKKQKKKKKKKPLDEHQEQRQQERRMEDRLPGVVGGLMEYVEQPKQHVEHRKQHVTQPEYFSLVCFLVEARPHLHHELQVLVVVVAAVFHHQMRREK